MNKPRVFLLIGLLVMAWVSMPSVGVYAADQDMALPIPRFVSLSSNEVNIRTGPGIRYPIRTIIRREGLPVEIIREFDVWRQVRDVDGEEGWIHKSMLSGRRKVIIQGTLQKLLKKAKEGSEPVVKLEPGVIANVDECLPKWCALDVAGYSGWIQKEFLWGVYPQETFEE